MADIEAWLDAQEKLCNPPHVPHESYVAAVERLRERDAATHKAFPVALKIIRALLAANEDADIPALHGERIAEQVLQEHGL